VDRRVSAGREGEGGGRDRIAAVVVVVVIAARRDFLLSFPTSTFACVLLAIVHPAINYHGRLPLPRALLAPSFYSRATRRSQRSRLDGSRAAGFVQKSGAIIADDSRARRSREVRNYERGSPSLPPPPFSLSLRRKDKG